MSEACHVCIKTTSVRVIQEPEHLLCPRATPNLKTYIRHWDKAINSSRPRLPIEAHLVGLGMPRHSDCHVGRYVSHQLVWPLLGLHR